MVVLLESIVEILQTWKSWGSGLPREEWKESVGICHEKSVSILDKLSISPSFPVSHYCFSLGSYHPSKRHSWYTCFSSLPRWLLKLKYTSYFRCSSICNGLCQALSSAWQSNTSFLIVSSLHSRPQTLKVHLNGIIKSIVGTTFSPLSKLFYKTVLCPVK